MYPSDHPICSHSASSECTAHLRAGLSFHFPGKVELLAETDLEFKVDNVENMMLTGYPSTDTQ